MRKITFNCKKSVMIYWHKITVYSTVERWSGNLLCVQWPFCGSPSSQGEEVPSKSSETPFPCKKNKMAPSWEFFNCWMCRWLCLYLGNWNRYITFLPLLSFIFYLYLYIIYFIVIYYLYILLFIYFWHQTCGCFKKD